MNAISGRILPIEVKSGATGSMKSLHQFMGEKGEDLAIRFDAGLPDQFEVSTTIGKGNMSKAVNYQLLSLPVYLVERLGDLVASEVM